MADGFLLRHLHERSNGLLDPFGRFGDICREHIGRTRDELAFAIDDKLGDRTLDVRGAEAFHGAGSAGVVADSQLRTLRPENLGQERRCDADRGNGLALGYIRAALQAAGSRQTPNTPERDKPSVLLFHPFFFKERQLCNRCRS